MARCPLKGGEQKNQKAMKGERALLVGVRKPDMYQ